MSFNSNQQLNTNLSNSDRIMRLNTVPSAAISRVPTNASTGIQKGALRSASKPTSATTKIDTSKYVKQFKTAPKMANINRGDISRVIIPSTNIVRENFGITGQDSYIHYIVIFLIIVFIILIFLYV